MRFSPLVSSTMMTATPVDVPEMVDTEAVSISDDCREERSIGPNSSAPTDPIIFTAISSLASLAAADEGLGRHSRAQATAWLAPLPPGPVWNDVPVKVSPPEGTRGVTVTRSVFREPIMVIVFSAMVGLMEGYYIPYLVRLDMSWDPIRLWIYTCFPIFYFDFLLTWLTRVKLCSVYLSRPGKGPGDVAGRDAQELTWCLEEYALRSRSCKKALLLLLFVVLLKKEAKVIITSIRISH